MSDWIRDRDPDGNGDCRKLVTLEQHGVIWVGIRAFDAVGGRWMNNNVSELAKVLAWQELPSPAYSNGLTGSMQAPTLPAEHG